MCLACVTLSCAAFGQSAPAAKHLSGAQLFKVYCSKCHSTAREYSLGPSLWHVIRPTRLTEKEFRKVVMKGRNTMPPFERRLSSADLDRLVAYIKTK